MPETDQKTTLEIEVRHIEIPAWRKALAAVREKPGMEEVTISLARALRGMCESLGLHPDVVNLYWEEFLAGQHIMMNELAKPEKGRLTQLLDRGLDVMGRSAKDAHQYILDNPGLEEQEKRSYRFLGRLYDYKQDYPLAIENYKKSIEMFDKEEDQMIRVNALEIAGFLCFSLIMNGQIDEGRDLAVKTFSDYFDSEAGRELKSTDYYTWAVWASGVPIRIIGALVQVEAINPNQIEWANDWLKRAEEVLIFPDGSETFGDKNFEYRKNELQSVRERLALI